MGGAAAKPAEEEAWPKQAGNDGIGLILGFGGIFFLMLANEQEYVSMMLRIQDYDDDYAGIVKGWPQLKTGELYNTPVQKSREDDIVWSIAVRFNSKLCNCRGHRRYRRFWGRYS